MVYIATIIFNGVIYEGVRSEDQGLDRLPDMESPVGSGLLGMWCWKHHILIRIPVLEAVF